MAAGLTDARTSPAAAAWAMDSWKRACWRSLASLGVHQALRRGSRPGALPLNTGPGRSLKWGAGSALFTASTAAMPMA